DADDGLVLRLCGLHGGQLVIAAGGGVVDHVEVAAGGFDLVSATGEGFFAQGRDGQARPGWSTYSVRWKGRQRYSCCKRKRAILLISARAVANSCSGEL